jgi:hypothetical protein
MACQRKSQVVRTFEQQLGSKWQLASLASPEAPPPPPPQALVGSLRLPFPFSWRLEEENEETPFEGIMTCLEVGESFWAAYWA